jgi:hypothetical protein
MWIRRASAALFLGLLLTAANSAFVPRGAEAGSHVFTVTGVQVDVTAETAAAAREAAHAEGHVKAMDKLLARLLPRDEISLIRQLKPAEILAYVQDFSVGNERTSDVRYLAELTFRFRPDPVRELLRASGLKHAETMSKPVVVLPIFGAGDAAVLWGEGNPWWAAWAARPPGGWLVPLIVPLGDLGDLAADTIFIGWMNAYNQSTIHSVIETQWLTLDDDDGDINNGTPNLDRTALPLPR